MTEDIRMPAITVDLLPAMLDRLQQIATEQSCSVEDVVRKLLAHAIEMYDTAKTPKEIQRHVESFNPTLARPVIDRARIQAMVDKYKPTGDSHG
jgi:hypothetical protein